MNAITHTGRGSSLAPQSWAEALQFSEMMARSDMVPPAFKGKPANIMLCLQWGAEVGLGPLQALQSIAVINGRPSLWGDAALALVRGHPACAGVREGVEGEGDAMLGFCEVTRRGEPMQRRTFSVADARKAGLWGKAGPWVNYPQRMLQMRARGFAIRDVFPDALRGVITAEEAGDIPAEPRQVPNLEQPRPTLAEQVVAARATLPVIAPATGVQHAIPPGRWLQAISKALGGLEDPVAMRLWSEAMAPHLAAAAEHDDALAHQAEMLIAGRMLELAGPPDEEPDELEPGSTEPEDAVA